MIRLIPVLLVLALWIYAFVDCLNTPEEQVRGLPKVVWVIVILLFGEVLVGPVVWLVAGKHRNAPAGGGAPARWVAPDDNPEFLRSLREERTEERTEEHTKDERLLESWEADLRRREEELRRRENGDGDGESGSGSGSDDRPRG